MAQSNAFAQSFAASFATPTARQPSYFEVFTPTAFVLALVRETYARFLAEMSAAYPDRPTQHDDRICDMSMDVLRDYLLPNARIPARLVAILCQEGQWDISLMQHRIVDDYCKRILRLMQTITQNQPELAARALRRFEDVQGMPGTTPNRDLIELQCALTFEMVQPGVIANAIQARVDVGRWMYRPDMVVTDASGVAHMRTSPRPSDAVRSFRVLYFALHMFAQRLNGAAYDARAAAAPLCWPECRHEDFAAFARENGEPPTGVIHSLSAAMETATPQNIMHSLQLVVQHTDTRLWCELLAAAFAAPQQSQLAEVSADMTAVFTPLQWHTIFMLTPGGDVILAQHGMGVVPAGHEIGTETWEPHEIVPVMPAADIGLALVHRPSMFSVSPEYAPQSASARARFSGRRA